MNALIILGVLLLVYFIYNIIYTYSETTYVKSDIDGKMYLIRRGNNKSDAFLKDSADTLAIIHKNVMKLIDSLDKNFADDSSKNYFIQHLKNNYKPYIISEAAIDPRYTTYTIDKKNMHICLRTRDTREEIYDINILMYVVLHELSHLCNYDKDGVAIIGHGTEFKNIFKFLVEESIKLNIYTFTNYKNEPHEYCGIMITSSIVN